jgi:putative peptidoglycan lipid II flippase
MRLVRSIATIGAYTAVSRILGFVRDVLIAAFLGAGPIADAFFVALRFPNMFRALFAEGAFSAAFVPIFVATRETEGHPAARRMAEEALGVLTAALCGFILVMELAMPIAMYAIAPGFAGSDTFGLAVEFSRLTFPYLLFISLAALCAGVLNSLGRFASPAAAPIILNVSLIAAMVGPGPWLPTMGHALAWGVVVAGLLQFLWLYVHCGIAGGWLRPRRPRLTPKVTLMLKRALPVAFGAGIHQVNILVDTVLASMLPLGSVSYLFYADRLSQLPYGIIAAAVSTALLPVLSREVRSGDPRAALHSQNRALEFAFLLMLPAATALIVLAEPFMIVLFQRGAFGPEAAAASAAALAAYSSGLPAYLLVKSLTPGYYAREDTATPVKIAGASAVVHVALSVVLMIPFAHVGIALSTALAAWFNAAALAVVLHRRGHLVPDARLKRRLGRTCLASATMAAALWLVSGGLIDWLDRGMPERVAAVAMMVASGLVVFAVSAQILGAATIADVRAVLHREKRG